MASTLTELVARFGGELLGDGSITIRQVAPLDQAQADEIGFVSQARYLAQLAGTHAAAVILPLEARDATTLPRILTPNPYLYFARVAALLNPPPRPPAGIHPAATVAVDARIAADASIGPGAVIGAGAVVGARTVGGPNCVVGDHARIGDDCLLHANVTLYHRCEVGDRAILHAGCVIGADGFGFAPNDGRWEKIPQIGRVQIGDDVEVGACTAIAGSAKIGRLCTIGGAAMIFGHIEIADGTRISTNTLITKSLPIAGTYTSALPFSEHDVWQKNAVHMRILD